MPQIVGSLLDGKPLVTVALSDAVPRPTSVTPNGGSTSFEITEYKALLDTGADITCLCQHVVHEQRLSPLSMVNMTSGNGQNHVMSYLVHLGVWCEEPVDIDGELEVRRSLYQFPDPLQAAVIQNNQWFDVIIGTDLISQHELTMMKGGKFRFTLG